MPPIKFTPAMARALADSVARQKLRGGRRTPAPEHAPAPPMNRRRFLGGAVVLVCSAPVFDWLAGCAGEGRGGKPSTAASDAGETGKPGADAGGGPALDAGNQDGGAPDAGEAAQEIDGWAVPAGTTLGPEDYACLAALFDVLIPGDEASPGATACHAAWYLDQLLGAFRTDPPRIYAGGPYSGRHGGLDGFSQFLPLTRVEELRWRTYLEGSNGLPEREWNGPVTGLVQRYQEAFVALHEGADAKFGKRFTECAVEERRSVLLAFAGKEFRQLAYEQANEGTYGDPVYGGNFEMKGWQVIDFEGDRQPIGFTARELLYPEEG